MKSNTEVLLDIIYKKRKDLALVLEELNNSLDLMDESKMYLYKHDLEQKKDMINFLDGLLADKNLSLDTLKRYLKENAKERSILVIKINKAKMVSSLLKEYKYEYRKNYWNNKYVGLEGVFDKELFCSIIKKRIDKYSYCNKVTRVKYKHLVAFLNEFLYEMENSNDPLKTLKHKMKLYQKYRKNEYVEIRNQQRAKVDIIKDILNEYKKAKILNMGCK